MPKLQAKSRRFILNKPSFSSAIKNAMASNSITGTFTNSSPIMRKSNRGLKINLKKVTKKTRKTVVINEGEALSKLKDFRKF